MKPVKLEKTNKKDKEIAVVYLAGGISSRFQGRIKQFAQIGLNGETLIEVSINQALAAGFNKIVFIVGNLTEKPFKEKFGSSYRGVPVEYSVQKFNSSERDKPWGTADAFCSINNIVECPFLICNGDDIYGEESFKLMYNHLLSSKEPAAVAFKVINHLPEKGKNNRGIYQLDKNNYLSSVTETYDIEKHNLKSKGLSENDLTGANIYAFHPSIFKPMCKLLENFKKKNVGDRKIEAGLPTFLSELIEKGKIKIRVYVSKEKILGITNPEDEAEVKLELEKKYKN